MSLRVNISTIREHLQAAQTKRDNERQRRIALAGQAIAAIEELMAEAIDRDVNYAFVCRFNENAEASEYVPPSNHSYYRHCTTQPSQCCFTYVPPTIMDANFHKKPKVEWLNEPARMVYDECLHRGLQPELSRDGILIKWDRPALLRQLMQAASRAKDTQTSTGI